MLAQWFIKYSNWEQNQCVFWNWSKLREQQCDFEDWLGDSVYGWISSVNSLMVKLCVYSWKVCRPFIFLEQANLQLWWRVFESAHKISHLTVKTLLLKNSMQIICCGKKHTVQRFVSMQSNKFIFQLHIKCSEQKNGLHSQKLNANIYYAFLWLNIFIGLTVLESLLTLLNFD